MYYYDYYYYYWMVLILTWLCSSPPSEPHAGFKIAFNMFDADGNQMVDKREFLVVGAILCFPSVIADWVFNSVSMTISP